MGRYQTYWGKAGDSGDYHPLTYHSIDVAATGLELLRGLPRLSSLLMRLSGLNETMLKGWVGFFLAIHDLGKFSSAFQQLRIDLTQDEGEKYHYSVRHDTLGYMFWIRECAQDESLLHRLYDRSYHADGDLVEIAETWVQCVTGHHGQPPKYAQEPLRIHFSEHDINAAQFWTQQAAELFLPATPHRFDIAIEQVEAGKADLSWWLAGLCTLADWLGSNQDYFPYRTQSIPIQDYLNDAAKPQAAIAVAASGILPALSSAGTSPEQLFSFQDFTPLQNACLMSPLQESGQLHIIEDVTGAGKTEAALILLARIMRSMLADGAYVALPTMATANAMYERTASVYRKLFDEHSTPSLVLAHGARHLDPHFQNSIVAEGFLPDESEYIPGEQNAEARCNAWLADNNKKALLAQVGVGTIDQALLAVLKSRHQSLRLLGLLGKVLIVDEVHASDAYMHRLLCELLRLHSSAGGRAILLSATLPSRMRQDLIRAWSSTVENERGSAAAYPLLTSVCNDGIVNQAVATRATVQRRLNTKLIHDESEVLDWLLQKVVAGHCVAWIRNTVDDAIRAWQSVTDALGEDRVTLFHARFALGDRLDIEKHVLATFGEKSHASSRAGKVVIATQVIEQSLDLDFDEMVTDLAPIDLLIQRAGRLRRHVRDQEGNRLDHVIEDQRGAATLHILTPPPVLDADSQWIKKLLPGTGAVYPDHARLWLSAKILTESSSIQIPEQLRDVIEYVYGDDVHSKVPTGLIDSVLRAEGQAGADASLARMNAISRSEGYRHSGSEWWDESRTPTRLGEPTVSIRLAKWDGTSLSPWRNDQPHPWAWSEVRIRERFLAGLKEYAGEISLAIDQLRASWPKAMKSIPIFVLRAQTSSAYFKAWPQGTDFDYIYSTSIGLTRIKKSPQDGEHVFSINDTE